MKKALDLLALQKDVFSAGSLNEFGFLAANKLYSILPYTHAIFWTNFNGSPKLHTVSGNAVFEENGPYAQWAQRMIKRSVFAQKNAAPSIIFLDEATIDDVDKDAWQNHGAQSAALVVFKTDKEGVLGGLWIERNTEFHEAEKLVLEEVQQNFSQACALHVLRARSRLGFVRRVFAGKFKLVLLAVLVLCSLFPVRLSVKAPAEIVSRDPGLVVADFDGALDEVLIAPGQMVKKGDMLAVMDDGDLEARMRASEQDMELARSKLVRLKREALIAPEKKAELEQVLSELRVREVEYEFAQKQLVRTKILAPRDGVAIFSDASSLSGKPVRTGEYIMEIANPQEAELLVRVPVDAMVPIKMDVPATFYMHVAPLQSHKAQIFSAGYQASVDPDGLLTYKFRGKFSEEYKPRIGWKGQAKLYGQWSTLFYAVLRRPLIFIRNQTGL